jgi:cell division control protein 45
MVYLPPPHLAGNRRSYLEAYKDILTSHRRSPLSSASSVIMLVAPNVDALCASQMFARLFKLDDVIYHIIPVSGLNEFEEITNELRQNTAVGIFQPCPLVVLIMSDNSCIPYY